jgi:uncharacterized membrane protein YecN with MAPEG domain
MMVHGLGGALLFARLAHAQGFLSSPNTSIGRFIGATTTLLVILAAAGILLSSVL